MTSDTYITEISGILGSKFSEILQELSILKKTIDLIESALEESDDECHLQNENILEVHLDYYNKYFDLLSKSLLYFFYNSISVMSDDQVEEYRQARVEIDEKELKQKTEMVSKDSAHFENFVALYDSIISLSRRTSTLRLLTTDEIREKAKEVVNTSSATIKKLITFSKKSFSKESIPNMSSLDEDSLVSIFLNHGAELDRYNQYYAQAIALAKKNSNIVSDFNERFEYLEKLQKILESVNSVDETSYEDFINFCKELHDDRMKRFMSGSTISFFGPEKFKSGNSLELFKALGFPEDDIKHIVELTPRLSNSKYYSHVDDFANRINRIPSISWPTIKITNKKDDCISLWEFETKENLISELQRRISEAKSEVEDLRLRVQNETTKFDNILKPIEELGIIDFEWTKSQLNEGTEINIYYIVLLHRYYYLFDSCLAKVDHTEPISEYAQWTRNYEGSFPQQLGIATNQRGR